MGYLDKVAVIKDDYRDLLRSQPGAGGPTLEEEALHGATESYSEDAIVTLATAIHAVQGGFVDGAQLDKDVIIRDAVGILDHLDTLGMEVRFKNG